MARTLKDAAVQWFVENAILKFLVGLKKDKGIMDIMQGAKTYIVAGLIVLVAAVELFGIDVPGFNMTIQEAVSVAVGLIFARGGARADVNKLADTNDLTKPADAPKVTNFRH
jgi:hypothetical protein